MNHIDPEHIKSCAPCRQACKDILAAFDCPHYIRAELQARCITCRSKI